MDRLQEWWAKDEECDKLIKELEEGKGPHGFSWRDRLLRRKGNLVVGKDLELSKDILTLFHASSMGRHSDVAATLQKVPIALY